MQEETREKIEKNPEFLAVRRQPRGPPVTRQGLGRRDWRQPITTARGRQPPRRQPRNPSSLLALQPRKPRFSRPKSMFLAAFRDFTRLYATLRTLTHPYAPGAHPYAPLRTLTHRVRTLTHPYAPGAHPCFCEAPGRSARFHTLLIRKMGFPVDLVHY